MLGDEIANQYIQTRYQHTPSNQILEHPQVVFPFFCQPDIAKSRLAFKMDKVPLLLEIVTDSLPCLKHFLFYIFHVIQV